MEGPIVFFDGYCYLCNQLVDFGIRFGQDSNLKWASLQGQTAAKLLPASLYKNTKTLVFYHRGDCSIEAHAAFAILGRLKRPWRALALLRFLPQSWTAFLYRLISRHRYRLWGRRKQCRVPTEFERKFFLD